MNLTHMLSLVIWLPIVGGALVSLTGAGRANTARWLALGIAILTFVDNFNAFDVIYSMAGVRGAPNYSTDLLATLFYRTAIAGEHPVGIPNMGIGAAIATLTFSILMTGVLAWLFLVRRQSEDM